MSRSVRRQWAPSIRGGRTGRVGALRGMVSMVFVIYIGESHQGTCNEYQSYRPFVLSWIGRSIIRAASRNMSTSERVYWPSFYLKRKRGKSTIYIFEINTPNASVTFIPSIHPTKTQSYLTRHRAWQPPNVELILASPAQSTATRLQHHDEVPSTHSIRSRVLQIGKHEQGETTESKYRNKQTQKENTGHVHSPSLLVNILTWLLQEDPFWFLVKRNSLLQIRRCEEDFLRHPGLDVNGKGAMTKKNRRKK